MAALRFQERNTATRRSFRRRRTHAATLNRYQFSERACCCHQSHDGITSISIRKPVWENRKTDNIKKAQVNNLAVTTHYYFDQNLRN